MFFFLWLHLFVRECELCVFSYSVTFCHVYLRVMMFKICSYYKLFVTIVPPCSVLHTNTYLCICVIKFSYSDRDENPVHVVQLTFLKLLSATAKQSFTYTCQNSAGWFDSTSRSYQHALRFRGSNDEELTQAKNPFVNAVHDGCQVSARTNRD